MDSTILFRYTDVHDVDEDMTSISVCGGNWTRENKSGVTERYMDNIPSHAFNFTASRLSTSEIIPNYTDFHDVDEDMMTSARCGGTWLTERKSGIAHRIINNTPFGSAIDVASR